MAKDIKSIDDVKTFLQRARELIDAGNMRVNNFTWADGKVNKTQKYLIESGIGRNVIREVIGELRVENYSSTKKDANPKFPGEQVWEFGITKNLIDQEENIYIKLKIREIKSGYLLIMSFHPEQPVRETDRLTFPYAKLK